MKRVALAAAVLLAGCGELPRRHGRDVILRIAEGGHDRDYWKRHLVAYLDFYAAALARC